MVIGLVAPPFIKVPPIRYGGTELFIAQLAQGLSRSGHEVVLYATGDSDAPVEIQSLYERECWPVEGRQKVMREIDHTAWAMRQASLNCDLIHINSHFGLPHSLLTKTPCVFTIHNPCDRTLLDAYGCHPEVHYVTISESQRRLASMPHLHSIHHGIDLDRYQYSNHKQPYLCFLGRITPEKGAHLAITVARLAGIPLKIAGAVQPRYQTYFDSEIKPQLDGTFIEYVGEADLAVKNNLLSNATALLFPIQWQEPFGLVMIEAMACGTPVLAFAGGAVEEIVVDGISGFVCGTVEEMVRRAQTISLRTNPAVIRDHVSRNFSVARMFRKYEALYAEVLASQPRPARLTRVARGQYASEHVPSQSSKKSLERALLPLSKRLCARPKQVLCVDDDEATLLIRTAVLKHLGYRVFTARSGPEALQVLQRVEVDAMVLDFQMPYMDGVETAQECRRIHYDGPILMLTAHDIEQLPEVCFALINQYVAKTTAPREFLYEVARLLDPDVQDVRARKKPRTATHDSGDRATTTLAGRSNRSRNLYPR
jgi:glycosyltransferase involved in cell wall biosynthesis/CheY-like chemotaxis protein